MRYVFSSFILALSLIQTCYAGENQWTQIVIENHTSKSLYLTDAILHYGKWYRTGCKSCEIKSVEQIIEPGSDTIINAAGRLLSPTGTEGEFAIYDGPKSSIHTTQILHAYFVCPYFLGISNEINVKPLDVENYPVWVRGGKLSGTYLGVVKIMIYDKDSIKKNFE